MGQEEQIFGRCGTILTEYPGDAPEIQVPGDITEVARYVFYGKEVQRAELPDGLSRLQEGAFRSCRKLQQIRLPNTLNTIDRYAFADCWKLEQASLSEGLEKIEDYAFHRTALKTVRIPDTVMEIGDHAFDTRGTLKIAVVPGSVRMIGRKAFSGAPGLPSREARRRPTPEKTASPFPMRRLRSSRSSNRNICRSHPADLRKLHRWKPAEPYTKPWARHRKPAMGKSQKDLWRWSR